MRTAVFAAIGVATLGLLAWGVSAPTPSATTPSAPAAERPSTAVHAPTAAAAKPTDDAVPPGLDTASWAALKAEHAGRPAELQRIVEFLVWQDRVRRFGAATGPERRALAAALDPELDLRLQRREIGAAEARLVKIALLDATVDDAAERHAALSRWESAAAPAPDPQRVEREARFQDRQAALVAAWSAQPESQRDRAALERQLDALRRASFDSPTGAAR